MFYLSLFKLKQNVVTRLLTEWLQFEHLLKRLEEVREEAKILKRRKTAEHDGITEKML